MNAWIQPSSDGCEIAVRVTPRASSTRIDGLQEGQLNIKLSSPPVDGKANRELLKFLKKKLGKPTARLSLISGEKNRSKRIRIQGRTLDDVQSLLWPDREA